MQCNKHPSCIIILSVSAEVAQDDEHREQRRVARIVKTPFNTKQLFDSFEIHLMCPRGG